MSQIKIVTKPGCAFCKILKGILDELGVDYIEQVNKNAYTAPLILDAFTGATIHKGLPKKSKLLSILKERNLL